MLSEGKLCSLALRAAYLPAAGATAWMRGGVSHDGPTSSCLDPVESTHVNCTQPTKKWGGRGGLFGEGFLVIHHTAFSGGGNCECTTVAGGGVLGGV